MTVGAADAYRSTMETETAQPNNSRNDGGQDKAPLSAPDPTGYGDLGLMRKSEVRVAERAVKSGWAIPNEAYEKLPQRLYDAAIAAERPEVLVNASRVLALMHSQNEEASRPAPVRNALTINLNPASSLPDDQSSQLAAAARIMRSTAIPTAE